MVEVPEVFRKHRSRCLSLMVRASPERGGRAGSNGAKRTKGSKRDRAMDTRGEKTAKAAREHGIELHVVTLEAKRGFVLNPRRGVVERFLYPVHALP